MVPAEATVPVKWPMMWALLLRIASRSMNVVSSIADTITVLARGAVLAEGPYQDVSRNPAVMEAYMGTTSGELQGAH